MSKVYVLTIEDKDTRMSIDSKEILVFKKLEKAKEYLQELKTNFLTTLTLTDDEYNDDIVEDEEMLYSWHPMGDYNNQHYILYIDEKEIL